MDSTNIKCYIGLDIGRSGARLCYTSFDPDTRTCPEPKAVMFDHSPQIPAAVGFLGGKPGVFTNRGSLVTWLARSEPEKVFYNRQKDEIVDNIPLARQALEALAAELEARLKSNLNIPHMASEAYPVTLGVPLAWGNEPQAIRHFTDAVQAGPLQTVQPHSDALAAVLYGIFKDLLPVEDRQQTWLVIDTAGIETRFCAVTKAQDIHNLQVEDYFTVDWGGDKIDQTLYANFLLPNYWKQPAPPDELVKTSLLSELRDLKERYATDGSAFGAFNHLRDTVELSREDFEADVVCLPLIREFANHLTDERFVIRPAFQNCEKVLLVGGGGNWAFVKQAVIDRWGNAVCVFPADPHLVIAKGLALAQTGFDLSEPQGTGLDVIDINHPTGSPPLEDVQVEEPIPQTRDTPLQEDSRKLKAKFHKKSHQVILWCVIAGAIFALIVSPIPCAAWPVLLILEAYMFYVIAKSYGFTLTNGVVVAMFAGLLGISFVLSLLVGEAVTFLSAFVAAPIVKPIVAALVIWGLGESAIAILDKQRFH